jgi:hypothetical protein
MKSLLLIALLGVATHSYATSTTISCPAAIAIKQEVLQVEGWLAHDPQTPHRFYFAQFSDGPPSREAVLLNDKESWSGNDKVLQFNFLPSQEPWLICSYTGTNAVLARKLPPAMRSCRLTLDKSRNFETVKEISCQQ